MSNFIKIRPMEAEKFHADRRTGMTKLKVSFRNFPNAPENEYDFSFSLSILTHTLKIKKVPPTLSF